MTTLLIDADIYVYRTACKCQPAPIDFGNGIFSLPTADMKEATAAFDAQMEAFKNETGAQNIVLALKGPGNFRNAILPSYKQNRSTTVRPILLGPLMDYLKDNYRVYQRPLLEGDDILGIIATSEKIVKGKKLIISEDKDLMQVPGTHYVPNAVGGYGYREVTSEQGDYLHMMQTLTGDAVDGYKGAPGVGPKKARQYLDGPRSLWHSVKLAYHAAGLTEADALVQARVARILRATDYNFQTKEPILWTPPGE